MSIRLKLLQIAIQAREWAEKANCEHYHYDEDLSGMCGIGAIVVSQGLTVNDVPHHLCIAKNGTHCFVMSDGYVVDVTASQFEEEPVVVQRATRLKTNTGNRPWYWEVHHRFDSIEEFRAFLLGRGWPVSALEIR